MLSDCASATFSPTSVFFTGTELPSNISTFFSGKLLFAEVCFSFGVEVELFVGTGGFAVFVVEFPLTVECIIDDDELDVVADVVKLEGVLVVAGGIDTEDSVPAEAAVVTGGTLGDSVLILAKSDLMFRLRTLFITIHSLSLLCEGVL